MRTKLLAVLSGLLVLGSAHGEIYKSVSSSGRVTYANVLPVRNAAVEPMVSPSTVISSRQIAQVSADSSPAASIRPVSARSRVSASGNDGGRILTPDVISAVANVMGVAQLVSSSREFCASAMPASNKRYSSAAQAWEQRNAAVVAQKNRILAHPVQQMVAEALEADMFRKTSDMMQPVRMASTAYRSQWCDKAFADVERGSLDLVGRPAIAPLMNYSRR